MVNIENSNMDYDTDSTKSLNVSYSDIQNNISSMGCNEKFQVFEEKFNMLDTKYNIILDQGKKYDEMANETNNVKNNNLMSDNYKSDSTSNKLRNEFANIKECEDKILFDVKEMIKINNENNKETENADNSIWSMIGKSLDNLFTNLVGGLVPSAKAESGMVAADDKFINRIIRISGNDLSGKSLKKGTLYVNGWLPLLSDSELEAMLPQIIPLILLAADHESNVENKINLNGVNITQPTLMYAFNKNNDGVNRALTEMELLDVGDATADMKLITGNKSIIVGHSSGGGSGVCAGAYSNGNVAGILAINYGPFFKDKTGRGKDKDGVYNIQLDGDLINNLKTNDVSVIYWSAKNDDNINVANWSTMEQSGLKYLHIVDDQYTYHNDGYKMMESFLNGNAPKEIYDILNISR